MGGRILLADNDPHFLKSRKWFLEKDGYYVIPAASRAEARRIIEQGMIDLAVLDLRLSNDRDKRDYSGLKLARETNPGIPKIVLTKYPTWQEVRDALGSSVDGLPPVVDFVAKQEGPEVLLASIHKALKRREAQIQRRDVEQLSEVVGQLKELLSPPALSKYHGHACAMITDEQGMPKKLVNYKPCVLPGELCRLEVWFQPRSAVDQVSELVNIEDGKEASEVNFDLAVDSDTLKFTPRRNSLTVPSANSSEHLSFALSAPEVAGEHDFWIEVFQKNRLVQVVRGKLKVKAEGGEGNALT